MSGQKVSSRRQPTIEIEYGPGYELLESLITFNEEQFMDFEIGAEWFENIRTRLNKELLHTIKSFYSECNHVWKHLFGLVYDSPAPKGVPELLNHIEEIDPFELYLHLLGYYRRSIHSATPLDVILQAAEGDEQAQHQFLKTAFSGDGDWRAALQYLFSRSPEEIKSSILNVLQSWYEHVFQAMEPQVLPILERDVAAKQALKQTLTPERLIETATNGLEYTLEPGIRKVLLVPSFILRPWNELSEYQDIKIVCYPVADESVAEDKTIPPARLVRLYKALADERRLHILKLLMTRRYSLQELADEFGVAKTTMHHHLATLRTVGLVRIQSNEKEYSLRHNMLSEVSKLLDAYLRGKP